MGSEMCIRDSAWCVSWGQEVFKNMRTGSWGLEVWNFAAGAWWVSYRHHLSNETRTESVWREVGDIEYGAGWGAGPSGGVPEVRET